jgi:hypothetical protein
LRTHVEDDAGNDDDDDNDDDGGGLNRQIKVEGGKREMRRRLPHTGKSI